MKRDDVFPSRFIKAADVAGKPLVVTIDKAAMETLKSPDGRQQEKCVVSFAKTNKVLALNKMNWEALEEIAGSDTNDWPGAKVELYASRTIMAGKTVDCVRVRHPAQRSLPPVPRHDQSEDPAAGML
jgi:hypothetical protein